MEIYPDPMHSLLLSLPFFVTMFALHVILFKPMLAYLLERDAVGEKALKEAESLEHNAAEKLSSLEDRLTKARHAAHDIRADARGRGQAAEAKIIAEARSQAEGSVAEALKLIMAERDAAKAALTNSAEELSTNIAGRVLGRPLA